jgi:GNAT superfamily N-acetyltransferase
MNISVQLFDPTSDPETVAGIVSCYQQAFGGAPWNEGYRCPRPECGKIFPLSEPGPLCPSCIAEGNAVQLVEFWPAEKVASDFACEMKKPGALCFVAKDEDRVVGFIWGYRIVIDEHIDDYLESPGLSRLISGTFFYIDDVAVAPKYQGRGIGKELVARVLHESAGRNILARTLDQSRMFHILERLHGKTVLRITRDRVIMAVSL